MSSTAPTTPLTQAARLEQRIREHQEDVARLRAQNGDPQEELFRFVRERFEAQAFVSDDAAERKLNDSLWEDDDELNAW